MGANKELKLYHSEFGEFQNKVQRNKKIMRLGGCQQAVDLLYTVSDDVKIKTMLVEELC